MGSSKRLVFLFTLVAINLLFTTQGFSLASKNAAVSDAISVAPTANADSQVINGAVQASASLPEKRLVAVSVAIPTMVKSEKIMRFAVTTYTSRPEETDDTPNITASGTRTRPGVAASNVLPFGTKFKIPALFGDQIFTIEDRMNSRYNGKRIVDIWQADFAFADAFGRKMADIIIVE